MNNHKEIKETLEIEKLKLEISELKKNPFKKVQFWSVVLPSLAALTTLFFLTVPSGLFDVKYENLKLEKNILTLDIKEFQAQKESIIDSLKTLKAVNSIQKIKLSKLYQTQENLNIANLTKDQKLIYYKKTLDSLTTLIINNSAIRKTLKAGNGDFSSDFNKDFSTAKILTDEKGNYLTTEDGQFIIAE